MRIGITGANGFVGRALVDRYRSRHELTLFVRHAGADAARDVRVIPCNLATSPLPRQSLRALDVLVHSAHGPALAPALARELLESYQQANPSGLFVFVSSINTQVSALSWDAYTRFKTRSEDLLKSASVRIPAVILRPAFVVSAERPGSLSPFLLVARLCRVLPLPDSGPRHLFVAMEDLVEHIETLASTYQGDVGVHEVDLIGNALHPLRVVLEKAAHGSGFRGKRMLLPRALCVPISAALPPLTTTLCRLKKLAMDLDVLPRHGERTHVCRGARPVLDLDFRWPF